VVVNDPVSARSDRRESIWAGAPAGPEVALELGPVAVGNHHGRGNAIVVGVADIQAVATRIDRFKAGLVAGDVLDRLPGPIPGGQAVAAYAVGGTKLWIRGDQEHPVGCDHRRQLKGDAGAA